MVLNFRAILSFIDASNRTPHHQDRRFSRSVNWALFFINISYEEEKNWNTWNAAVPSADVLLLHKDDRNCRAGQYLGGAVSFPLIFAKTSEAEKSQNPKWVKIQVQNWHLLKWEYTLHRHAWHAWFEAWVSFKLWIFFSGSEDSVAISPFQCRGRLRYPST